MSTILDAPAWRARRAAHEARVDAVIAGHRERAARGEKHPIEDFLFEYYSHRPAHLRRWSPGHGVVLADADELGTPREWRRTPDGLEVDVDAIMDRRGNTVRSVVALLEATLDRAPSFGCFGMHEWAMVLGHRPEQTRHPQLGLRFSPERTADIVAERGLRCTHVDAYRFFTERARPANAYAPTRDNQLELDQPGCLHVGMDLYRSAYKLSPLVSSELVVDCFELAREIRVLDMRASAYDVSSLGHTPVAVETPQGRADYVRQQREFSERARPLRVALLDAVRPVAGASGSRNGSGLQ
ncbi:3-methyladenine DNA glycosylase [Mariniluteicoccus flavus]